MNAHPIKAWSHSTLTSFETCPKRHWHLNVKKDYVETKSDMQDWGTAVHTAMEKFFRKGTPFPLGMKHFEPIVAPLTHMQAEVLLEQKLALDYDFKPTGWFGEGVWVRVVIDAAFINDHRSRAMIIDWKTGKRSEDDDQLALMAGVMFAQMPELDLIESAFCWLQEKPANAFARSTFTKDDVPEIWDRFLRRVTAFQDAHRREEFPAIPSGLCRKYCPVKSCPYNGAS